MARYAGVHCHNHLALAWILMLLMAWKSSLESSQLSTSRLLRKWDSLLALGMTDVPCWMPQRTRTCTTADAEEKVVRTVAARGAVHNGRSLSQLQQ